MPSYFRFRWGRVSHVEVKGQFKAGSKGKKEPWKIFQGSNCGGRGIRTPGEFPHNGFQDRHIRPLCQPSSSPIAL